MLDNEGNPIIENGMAGYNAEYEIKKLVQKVADNVAFLNQQDIIVLEYLATKGDYPEQQATLVKLK